MPLGPIFVSVEGKELTTEDKKILSHDFVGGVVLFSRNYENKDQLRLLIKIDFSKTNLNSEKWPEPGGFHRGTSLNGFVFSSILSDLCCRLSSNLQFLPVCKSTEFPLDVSFQLFWQVT